MSEPVPADGLAWVVKIAGGGAGTYVLIRALNVWGSKLNLNLAADQANAALRTEMGAMLTDARGMLKEAQRDLDATRAQENECRKRLAIVEGSVEVLREEVERLSHLLLKQANPGLEGTLEFDARIASGGKT